jgi:peptidyl-prolyl cis-trans isomerase D
MPIMTRMRESMPVILFGLLIAFLVTIIFEWGMDYLGTRGGKTEVVGKVNGHPISYQDFSEMLKSVTENQKAQKGAELDDNTLRQSREQVWQALVTQQVLQDEIKRLGITVTDQEIVDWVRGDNPPEDLRGNFVDSTGQFRKDLYEQFLSNPNQFLRDPEGKDAAYGTRWLANYEKSLRQRRSQEKLQSVVLASVRVTEGEVFRRYCDQSQRFEAAFALFDPGQLVKDSAVQVTDSDLRKYYEEHLEQYKVTAARTLKYAFFPEVPSAGDSSSRQSGIEDAAKKVKSGMDFLEVVSTYSDKPDSGTFFRHGELSQPLEKAVFASKVGDVVGPILDAGSYRLMKVLEERRSGTEYVHVSHILFQMDASKDTVQAKATAQRVAREAREGKDFAALARQYSQDPSTGQRGGELGWVQKGRMVKAFDEAAFKAKPGEIVGPVRTPFGLHIIKVHARDARELKVASVVMAIEPSSQTKNDIFQRSQDFAYNAKESDFVKEAASSGLEPKEIEIQEEGGVIPGLGVNPSVTRWAFSSKVGSVSESYSFTNGYAVFSVVKVRDAGVQPFDEVKEMLRPATLREKKIVQVKEIAAGVRAKLAAGDSLARVSTLMPGIRVQQTGSFTLNSSVMGIGRDPAFLGAVEALSPGQISPAVQSQRGAYLIQLFSRTPVDSVGFVGQRDGLRAQVLQEKRNRFLSEWLEKAKADADIVDHRDMFFR